MEVKSLISPVKPLTSERANSSPTENAVTHKAYAFEACPLCGRTGAQEWLRAPDRLHGRQQIYTLARCPECTLVWLSHPPQPSEMGQHYTPEYHRLISGAGETSPKRWQDHREALRL